MINVGILVGGWFVMFDKYGDIVIMFYNWVV